jgi:hypothetical protein
MVDVSARVGWDVHCAEELSGAAALIAQAGGNIADAVALQAAAIACAIRSGLPQTADLGDPEQLPADIVLTEELILRGSAWMSKRSDYPALGSQVINEVRRLLRLDEGSQAADRVDIARIVFGRIG